MLQPKVRSEKSELKQKFCSLEKQTHDGIKPFLALYKWVHIYKVLHKGRFLHEVDPFNHLPIIFL